MAGAIYDVRYIDDRKFSVNSRGRAWLTNLAEERPMEFEAMVRREIWAGDVRRVLYRRLVELFGPYEEWEKAASPGKGRDEEFDEFCNIFAQTVGAKSGGAVEHQIRFALPETESGSVWHTQAQAAILNKAAALEAGFIKDKHLPNPAVGRRVTDTAFDWVNQQPMGYTGL